MIPKQSLIVISLIIFIVPVGVFLPSFIEASSQEDREINDNFEINEVYDINEHLTVKAEKINDTDEIDVLMTDTKNGETDRFTMNIGDSQTFSFSEGDIQVDYVDKSGETLFFAFEYPSDYGNTDTENTINDMIALIIGLPILVIVLMIIFTVMGVK